MKKILKTLVFAMALLSFASCTVYTSTATTASATPYYSDYQNPIWAPTYYNGSRYYYLPDIETFYDIKSGSFVVLYNGQWHSVSSLTPYYPNYNLNTAFVVILNNSVYNPWRQAQYYFSHYPRYYYRDYYDHSNIPYVRGYNENRRSAVYWPERFRSKARAWDDQNLKNSRKFRYSDEDRRMQEQTIRMQKEQGKANPNQSNEVRRVSNNTSNTRQAEVSTPRYNSNNGRNNNSLNRDAEVDNNRGNNGNKANSNVIRSTDGTHYFGNKIGQPVKVDKNMRSTQSTNNSNVRSSSSSNRSSTGNNTTTTRRSSNTQNSRNANNSTTTTKRR